MLTRDQVEQDVRGFCARLAVEGRHVVVLVPDATRSAPMRLMAGLLDEALEGRAAQLDFLVALGTHQPMSEQALEGHLGTLRGRVVNHAWDDPEALTSVGTISAQEVEEISEGRLAQEIDVRLNRLVVDADLVVICGPVFPHEVVGFSGGNKYLFPGVSGQEVIDATHWLGALITSWSILGTLGTTPVRRLIDRAAALVPTQKQCVAMVVSPSSPDDLVALAFGTPEAAWAEAADVSSRTHVTYVEHTYRRVLSVMPAQYDDIWTAAKGMYKVEPVVADGGEVVIHAPHITEISVTHGEALRRIGYHVRDYFTGQPERFADVPGSLLAHSTHLRGQGTWSEAEGERARIAVTLATGIDEATCREFGLGYLDPAAVDVEEWDARSREDDSLLVVRKAGEMLFRLR